ncbi:hypothetical protein P4S67_02865 [Pseudoalteromonas sp. B137]
MARSLAFWFDDEPAKNTYDVDLHINFWSFDSEKVNYLDIGVLVKSKKESISNNINIYFPFKITHDDYFSELGSLVCSDRELISAIFNTNISKTQADSKNDIFKIEFSPKNKLSFHTQILPETDDSEGGVKLKAFNENTSISKERGTILKFPSELFQSTDGKATDEEFRTDYFRFRIKLSQDSKNILGPEYSPKGSFITNYFNSTEMIDFRINEPRNLPSKIRAKLNESLKLKQVHFFLIRDANAEFKMSHSKYKRCRILENNIWKKYLKLGVPTSHWWEEKLKKHCRISFSKLKLPEQMLIYHWAENSNEDYKNGVSIDHFSAFAKFSQRKTGFFRMASVVLFVLSLGVTASILANILMVPLDNVWNSISKSVESSDSPVPDIEYQGQESKNSNRIFKDEATKNDCE